MKIKWLEGFYKATDIFIVEPVTKYMIIITTIISILLVTEAWLDGTQNTGIFLSLADRRFIINFVEWFGVIYGFVWSTFLVKVWVQFEDMNNTFDREVDAIQILAEDLSLLNPNHKETVSLVLASLQVYARNVLDFMKKKINPDVEKKNGDEILSNIRTLYITLFQQKRGTIRERDVILGEILSQLNTIIDSRGDRITLLAQRKFESLQFISVVTSIVWLAPFYFLYYLDDSGNQLPFGIFGWLLIIAVTFLVIVVLSIIDDLDTPFDGYWIVDIESWKNLVADLDSKITLLQEENYPSEIKIKPEQTIIGMLSVTIDIIASIVTLTNQFLSLFSPCKKSR